MKVFCFCLAYFFCPEYGVSTLQTKSRTLSLWTTRRHNPHACRRETPTTNNSEDRVRYSQIPTMAPTQHCQLRRESWRDIKQVRTAVTFWGHIRRRVRLELRPPGKCGNSTSIGHDQFIYCPPTRHRIVYLLTHLVNTKIMRVMKCPVYCDITLCSPLKAKDVSEEYFASIFMVKVRNRAFHLPSRSFQLIFI